MRRLRWFRTAAGRGLLAALSLAVAVPGPASAQSLDPATLQRLQGQLGAGPSASEQLDASRDRASGNLEPAEITRDAPTQEELQLRRAQSRRQLESIVPPSPIELEYRQRTGDTSLRLFGYDLFQAGRGAAGPLTGALGGDYVLGVGDELVISFQGATSDSRTVRVDREGRVVVGSLPPVRAAGRSLGAVRADLSAATRRTLLGTDVNVSVGSVRSISVFVGGEVGSPGVYQLTSLADIASALSEAGGIRRTGSLRRVRVVRGGRATEVDLYGLLGIGSPTAFSLREGDRVIVPVIGATAAITGAVARPAIYELRGPTTLGTLLGFAGGAVRPRGQDISVSRIGADGQETFLRGSASTALQQGDAVQVLGGSAGGAAGRVLLSGFVANPGSRPLSLAPTVGALLGSLGELQVGTYLPAAVIVGRDVQTGARRFQVVDLTAALTGQRDVALQDEDRLFVLSRDDAAFINRPSVRSVALGRPNPLPGCAPLERLEQLVRDTQSQRYSIITRGVYQAGGVIATVAPALTQPSTAGPPDVRVATDERGLSSTCPAVFQTEPELLPVLIENAVSVGGVVRQPGAYPVAGPVSAARMAALAEGLLGQTANLEVEVTRSSGATTVQDRVALAELAMAETVVLAPGDDVRFSANQARFENGAVLLSGEVGRPGLYTVRRGERLSELLDRAGGLTSLAYPYGTIFTRRSVQEEQQQGFRRTARELNEALLSTVARRSEGTNEQLGAASQIIAQLGSVEAPGRVVVESDPRVLALRPDLDTILEAGDSVFIPKRPNYVLAIGDVSNPGALQFVAGKSVEDYLRESGGFRRSADDDQVFVVYPNGSSQPLRRSFGRIATLNPPPGSTIVVPKNIDPLYNLDVARDIATIVGQFVSSVATVAILATN